MGVRKGSKKRFRWDTLQINLQSLQLSLGEENPELFQRSIGHSPPFLFLRERVSIRFPSIFRKHLQRFIPFLGWDPLPLAIGVKTLLACPRARLQPGLAGVPHTRAPQTRRGQPLSPEARSHPPALTARRDAGVEGPAPRPAPRTHSPAWAEHRPGES